MSSAIVHYGQASSEKTAEENQTCRQIVREVMNFGISQRQQLLLIYLIALELEDVTKMKSITEFMKEVMGNDVFLTNNEVPDGSTDL